MFVLDQIVGTEKLHMSRQSIFWSSPPPPPPTRFRVKQVKPLALEMGIYIVAHHLSKM